MRKINVSVMEAVREAKEFHKDSTQVVQKEDDGVILTKVMLHNDIVAITTNELVSIYISRYLSDITTARINATLKGKEIAFKLAIRKRKYVWFEEGKEGYTQATPITCFLRRGGKWLKADNGDCLHL